MTLRFDPNDPWLNERSKDEKNILDFFGNTDYPMRHGRESNVKTKGQNTFNCATAVFPVARFSYPCEL